MAGLATSSHRIQLAPPRPSLARLVGLRPLQARKLTITVSCSNESNLRDRILQKFALPAAVLLASAMCFAAGPNYALAARSGGRMGGSAFSSRR